MSEEEMQPLIEGAEDGKPDDLNPVLTVKVPDQ